MADTRNESDALERRTLILGGAYAAVACTACLPLFGAQAALSVPLGSALGLLNLWLLGRSLAALIRNRALPAWGVFMLLKLSVSGLVLLGLLRLGWVSALPFVIGLGAVPIALSMAQLFGAGRLGAPPPPAS